MNNKEDYQKLIVYLQDALLGTELTKAEMIIHKINPAIKLVTNLSKVDGIPVYVNINDSGKIISVDNDAKILAEFL